MNWFLGSKISKHENLYEVKVEKHTKYQKLTKFKVKLILKIVETFKSL